MQSAFIYSDRFGDYQLSPNHPYDPIRGKKAFDLLSRFYLLSEPGMEVAAPGEVGVDDLTLVHSRHFLELLRRAGGGDFYLGMLEYGIGTEDCPVFPGLLDFMRLCVGATAQAADLVMEQGFQFAFNPLGGFHHAGRAMAEGFCYINDIAVVARRLADRGKKVAVIDIDAHHGNGTQEIFYDDPRVLTVSIHESGQTLYPWGGEFTELGEGPGLGFNVNVPMPANSDDEVFLFAFSEVVPPLLKAFSPDLVIGIMGVDTFSTDPLTHLKMTNNSYVQAGQALHKLSPRWIGLGAGGYNMDNVARSWTLLWAVIHGLDKQDDFSAAIGGSFMGDMDLGVASLRDMNVRTSGPDKARAVEEVDKALSHIYQQVFPILGAK